MGFNNTMKAQNDSIPLEKEIQKNAIELAEFWVSQLISAENIDTLVSISQTPFAQDRKKILTSNDQLREFYQMVFDKKGKRDIDSISSKVVKFVQSIEDKVIPITALLIEVRVTIKGRESGILVSVQITESQKIIGFSD